MENVSN